MTAFVVRRFVDRGLLVDLSANPDRTLHHLDQVAEVCRRQDLEDLVVDPALLSRSRSASAPAGAVDVAIVAAHPEVDWEQLRTVEKGRRSPLAALRPDSATAPA
ncbi:hypothetical protein [Streptomyces halstedii]|uniref:hypothetical protein n=1 Tax=Streptomyces halstedii TaxID=1944 RepID=UPI003655DD07